MWKLVVLVSAAALSFGSPTEPERVELSAPSSLRTGSASDTSVVLRWDFVKPDNVSLSDMAFRIKLDQWPQAFRFPYEAAPLRYTFDHLRPGHSYTVYLFAVCAYCYDSPPVNITFTTMKKDWPSPSITSVTPSLENGVSYYEVKWKELPRRWLFYIKIEVCDPACVEYTEEAAANSTFVPVKWKIAFSVRLCAVYNEKVAGRIERYSTYVFPDAAEEKAVLRWAKVKRSSGNGLELEWNTDLSLLEGSRTYYEVVLCDSSPRLEKPNAKELTTSLPEPIQDDEQVKILDGGLHRKLQSLTISSSGQTCEVDGPVLFKVLRRTQKARRFRIVFETSAASSFGPDNATEAQYLLLAPNFAKTLNLSPFKPIHFLIRSCSWDPHSEIDFCGNFTVSDIVSSVAEPSPVRSASRKFVARGLLGIFWEEPAEPRGPIDGYIIEIRRIVDGQTTKSLVTVAPSKRSYHLPLPIGTEVSISIAAFNFDTDDMSELLLGDWVKVKPGESRYDATVLVVGVTIAIATVGFSFIHHLFRRKRSRRRVHQVAGPLQPFGIDIDRTAFQQELRQMRPPVRFRQVPRRVDPAPVLEQESSV